MIKEIFKESYFNLRWKSLKRYLFGYLTNETGRIFTKGGDLISIDSQLFGAHEPLITKLISDFTKIGFKDFFLDIGGNIGINSCQSGNEFKELHLFEPNPLCQKIAEVNLSISLNNVDWVLHPYGLGSTNYNAILRVPKSNWGGGYIVNDDNSYDDEILLKKEGQTTYNPLDYLEYSVEIREASSELGNIFNDLINHDRCNGVIKIDVEGMEPKILEAIAKSLPQNMKVCIIFESFNHQLDFLQIIRRFKGRAKGYVIQTEEPFNKSDNKIYKACKLLLSSEFRYKLEPFESRLKDVNDLVLIIN
jgi:FkbM family methyltransferase